MYAIYLCLYEGLNQTNMEVTFCLTCYLTVLAVEYAPIVLKNRKLRQIPSFLVFEFELHEVMYVLAGVGTFLSFFHQGSLGGLYGVMRGRPFAFREAIGIWPSTFFLFVLSAAAVGPSFIMLTTWLVSKLSKKTLVKKEVFTLLAKVSGTSFPASFSIAPATITLTAGNAPPMRSSWPNHRRRKSRRAGKRNRTFSD
ncbi:MAG: hypothetical protein ACREOI_18320 [bacterium]